MARGGQKGHTKLLTRSCGPQVIEELVAVGRSTPNSESPVQHHAFFTAVKKRRVPMHLATGFSEDKAWEFW